MTSIIDLLTEKNGLLEKFYKINEQALEKFLAGNFEGLEAFYEGREGLLTIIKKIDEKIESMNQIVIDKSQIDNAIKRVILSALEYKNELVSRILEQDLKLLSAIEMEKSSLIKELTQVRTARKAVSAYGRNTSVDLEDKK